MRRAHLKFYDRHAGLGPFCPPTNKIPGCSHFFSAPCPGAQSSPWENFISKVELIQCNEAVNKIATKMLIDACHSLNSHTHSKRLIRLEQYSHSKNHNNSPPMNSNCPQLATLPSASAPQNPRQTHRPPHGGGQQLHQSKSGLEIRSRSKDRRRLKAKLLRQYKRFQEQVGKVQLGELIKQITNEVGALPLSSQKLLKPEELVDQLICIMKGCEDYQPDRFEELVGKVLSAVLSKLGTLRQERICDKSCLFVLRRLAIMEVHPFFTRKWERYHHNISKSSFVEDFGDGNASFKSRSFGLDQRQIMAQIHTKKDQKQCFSSRRDKQEDVGQRLELDKKNEYEGKWFEQDKKKEETVLSIEDDVSLENDMNKEEAGLDWLSDVVNFWAFPAVELERESPWEFFLLL